MKQTVHFTMTIEDSVLALIDIGTGLSITNGAEDVIAELAWMFASEDFAAMRVIYRDTTGTWDGLAKADARFLTFVPLHTPDRREALRLARAGIDRNGQPWPE